MAKYIKVTLPGGYDFRIQVTEWDRNGPVPAVLSEHSVVSAGQTQNRIREDLAIIRRMDGGRNALNSYDFRLTYCPTDGEYRLWVRNWSGGGSGRASYYAGMILAYRKLTQRYKSVIRN